MLDADAGRPTAACLRRAVSSAYYALFHHLAGQCADLLIGDRPDMRRSDAWRQVYRALEHREIKSKCDRTRTLAKFPSDIQNFAKHLSKLQEQRHDADYDPFATFVKSEIQVTLILTEHAMRVFERAPKTDRRAFCAYMLLKDRPR